MALSVPRPPLANWLPNFAFNHLVRTKQGGETYRLGRALGVAVPEHVASEASTVAELIDLLLEHLERQEATR